MKKPQPKTPSKRQPPVDGTHVTDYLASRELIRLVRAAFGALPDEAAFWQSPEFATMRRRADLERLSLDNVVSRIEHCHNPKHWLRRFAKIASGELTLPAFVGYLLSKRK